MISRCIPRITSIASGAPAAHTPSATPSVLSRTKITANFARWSVSLVVASCGKKRKDLITPPPRPPTIPPKRNVAIPGNSNAASARRAASSVLTVHPRTRAHHKMGDRHTAEVADGTNKATVAYRNRSAAIAKVPTCAPPPAARRHPAASTAASDRAEIKISGQVVGRDLNLSRASSEHQLENLDRPDRQCIGSTSFNCAWADDASFEFFCGGDGCQSRTEQKG